MAPAKKNKIKKNLEGGLLTWASKLISNHTAKCNQPQHASIEEITF